MAVRRLTARFRSLLSSTDDRTGALDLTPVVHLIGIVGLGAAIVAALSAWFYFPQEGALENTVTDTLHDQYAGVALCLFCFVAVVPTIFLRVKGTSLRSFFWAWLGTTRRFLVAHVALTTFLYLLLAVGGTFWGARFEAEWLQVNASGTTSSR